MRRDTLAAFLLALCAASIVIGVGLWSVAAGFVVAGVLGAVLTWLVVPELHPKARP